MSKYKYQPHEKSLIYNDDRDLEPIEIHLPDPPPLETIEGYGLPPQEQFWRKKQLPARLKALDKQKKYKDNPDDPEEKEKIFTPRLKCLHLEKNASYYREEIRFIQNEWHRREHGHWFFNNGVPTWITGDHYYYLQGWDIDDRPPRYRARDRKWFVFWKMVEEDDNCFGMNYPKQRREGATTRVSCIRCNRATYRSNFHTALQSKDEDHAEKVHDLYVRMPLRKIPFYWQAIQGNKQNMTREVRFYSPDSPAHPDYGEKALDSLITFSDSGEKALDGLKIWLIHNDEIGKTTTADVERRVQIQTPCLTNLDPDLPIKGKMINTSTVDEMDKGGGQQFKNICEGSHYWKRPANNMTETGLYNLFIPAKEGMEGFLPGTKIPFYDKYGNCNSEAVEEFLIAHRTQLRMAGKMDKYIEACRLYPLQWSDCWKTSATLCRFNLRILEDRLEHYRNGNNDKVQGNFVWTAGRDSTVRFEPCENGKFFLSWNFPDPKQSNNFYVDPDGRRMPRNKNRFVAGGDPFKFQLVKNKSKQSSGGGAVFWRMDPSVGDTHAKPQHEWQSNRFICTYSNRPPTKEEYGEDMIMMCVYFGCEMNQETNVNFLWDYFRDRGYSGFLYHKFDPNTGKVSETPGSHTGLKSKEDIFAYTQTYIENHGMRECHDELLTQWKEVEDDLQPYDLMVAAGKALEADALMGGYSEEGEKAVDITDYFDMVEIG